MEGFQLASPHTYPAMPDVALVVPWGVDPTTTQQQNFPFLLSNKLPRIILLFVCFGFGPYLGKGLGLIDFLGRTPGAGCCQELQVVIWIGFVRPASHLSQ